MLVIMNCFRMLLPMTNTWMSMRRTRKNATSPRSRRLQRLKTSAIPLAATPKRHNIFCHGGCKFAIKIEDVDLEHVKKEGRKLI